MKRALSILLASLFVFMSGSGQSSFAADCVEVDIELPTSLPGDGFFELINCGDEAGTIMLNLDVVINQFSFTIGTIPVMLGAGETISREFSIPDIPMDSQVTLSLCITATSGTAEATDCSSLTLGGSPTSGDARLFGFKSTSVAECVEVDLELPDTINAGAASFAEGSFELTNCGDEAAIADLELSLELFDTSLTVNSMPVSLGAGETVARQWQFPVPPMLPAGTYVICVKATSGAAMSVSCQTIVVVNSFGQGVPGHNNGGVGGNEGKNQASMHKLSELINYPNPFNPTTTISFVMVKSGRYELTVYNAAGQNVNQFSGNGSAGDMISIDWDGSKMSTGIYLYKLEMSDYSETRKMLLVK